MRIIAGSINDRKHRISRTFKNLDVFMSIEGQWRCDYGGFDYYEKKEKIIFGMPGYKFAEEDDDDTGWPDDLPF